MARPEEIVIGRRLKTSYISTVVSITLVLYVLGLLGLIVMHARKLSEHVKENIGFSIVIMDNARNAEISQLQKNLEILPAVKSTEFISSDKAAEDLMAELGEDFVEFLGYNPLFPSIEVKLHAAWANPDSLSVFESEVLKSRIVKEVDYQKNLVHIVNENVRKIGIFLFLFGVLLLVIAFSLINNTIRLSVFSKRFLIKSMQLVGATQSFIRKPFVIKGIIQGIIGAAISIALLLLSLYAAQKSIPELINFQDIEMLFTMFALVIFLGIIVSWISTHFAVKKYLHIKTDNLYLY
ncbi:MAG: permease-like cell division protein FtsX [Bacteroidales bacterium]|nr:permease-like cell division protein FtsX [Bacteroidales bacterium]